MELPASAPSAVTQTTVTDQGSIKIEAGDTFQSIAQRKYGDAKYADSLRDYNQKDELAAQLASASLKAGKLVPGEFIMIPSVAELAKYTPANRGSPAPVTPPPMPPVPAPLPSVPQSSYKVITPGGETLYAIGKALLKDEDGWMKIKMLNPQIDSTQPVLAGTVLIVPEGTVVPKPNQP